MLVLETLLRQECLLPCVAPCCGLFYLKLLRSSGNEGRPITTRSFRLARPIDPVFGVGPVRSTTPFCFLTELLFEMGPDIIDTRQMLGEGFVRCRYDVVLLFEGHEHFLDLECRVEEQCSPRDVARIKDG